MNTKMNERWRTPMKLKYLSCTILAPLA
ncbi:hypothetical protein, partial [Escherichia coli]